MTKDVCSAEVRLGSGQLEASQAVGGRTAVVRDNWGWVALAVLLAGLAVWLALVSDFHWKDRKLIEMPALPLAAALFAAGLAFLALPGVVRRSLSLGYADDSRLLAFIIAAGLGFRLVLMASTPAFEDDWYRYLWDGAVTAHGYNPYAVSPDDAQGEPYHYSLQRLAQSSGVVIERINHSHLRTIYPPVAQGAFAVAYWIEPWSLMAWRAVLLAAELATLVALLFLLRGSGLSPLWVALYWWNPLVIKEIVNSAHMEGIVTPLVLGALVLATRGRHLAATTMLGLAAGAKLWPVLLAPLMLRPLWGEPRRLAAAVALLAALGALWAWPVLAAGFDANSGFVAFAKHWRTNSALFPALQWGMERAMAGLAIEAAPTTPGLIVRGVLAGLVGLVALAVSLRPIADTLDLVQRAATITAVLYLLSPVQFPWYAIWMLPFLCFRPTLGLLAVTAFVPLYYSAFHFLARDTYDVFRTWVVALIWVPVWSLLAWEAWWARRAVPARERPDA